MFGRGTPQPCLPLALGGTGSHGWGWEQAGLLDAALEGHQWAKVSSGVGWRADACPQPPPQEVCVLMCPSEEVTN